MKGRDKMKNEYDYLNDVKMDFSLYEEEHISEEEVINMKKLIANSKKTKTKRYFIAVCAAALTITCTAFAGEEYIDRIVKTISTGHNFFYQMDINASHELPDGLKGKVFDKNGNPLNKIRESDLNNMYDSNGNIIDNVELAKMYEEFLGGKAEISETYNADEAEKSYYTIDEIQNSIDFDIKLPEYIPEGYSFLRAYQFKDEDGSVSGLYANIEYKNDEDNKIFIHERLINDETAFESSTDGTIEEIEINGRKAVIQDDDNIDWETEDNVSVGISTKGNITKEEMIKMAESVK